jgi:HAE1 family hydrophobic/amphiphilic exporter-1
VAAEIVGKGNASPVLTRLNQTLRSTVPQVFVDVDRTKAKRLNVSLDVVFQTLQATLGSTYVNDFNQFGRTWRVMIQGDAQFRQAKRDIDNLQVRSNDGKMVPLGTLVKVRDVFGPQQIGRFNLYRTTTITGSPAPGYTDGQAVAEIERIAKETMPPSMAYEWSGMTYQQKIAGNLAPVVFGLAIVFVFLFLAAQYESWVTPMAVMLSVPVAILGAVGLTLALSLENNTYFQVGLVLLIGLSTKTAVLLVEFSKQLREEGKGIVDAALVAARLRFRPILMTAISFVLGVIPLLVATGAGAVSRRCLGTAVFGGMVLSVVVGVFLIPVLDVVVQRFASVFSRGDAPASKEEPKPAASPTEGS